MIKKEKVAIYIDGGNTYRRLKDLDLPESHKKFDYTAFVENLLGKRKLISKRYYVGVVKI